MKRPDSLRSREPEDGHGDADPLIRSYVLSVRLMPADRVRVAEAALAVGISASAFARVRLFGEPLPGARPSGPVPAVEIDTYLELGRIGDKINRLARRFNLRSGEDPSADEVLGELRRLLPLVREVERQRMGPA